MKREIHILCLTLMFLLAGVSAYATPYTLTIGSDSSMEVSGTGNGFKIWTEMYDLPSMLLLHEGQPETFKFAKMGKGKARTHGHNFDTRSITAYLDLAVSDTPVEFSGQIAKSKKSKGPGSSNKGWSVSWDGPADVYFGDGGHLSIALSDAEIKNGCWQGPQTFCGNAWADIIATVTLESAPVPEPSTMILFGIGLLGFTGISRKKWFTR